MFYNVGQGIQIGETVWAPVNCGYHATDFQWGKLYQWGRKYGQGYTGIFVDGDWNNTSEVSDAETPELIAPQVLFPYAGMRSSSGDAFGRGNIGSYWSSGHLYDGYADNLVFYFDNDSVFMGSINRSYAQPVRCVQE